jgi:hypothetical protein
MWNRGNSSVNPKGRREQQIGEVARKHLAS